MTNDVTRILSLPAVGLTNSSAERVARGAAWLDERFPGWERKIDLGILDISDAECCVCAQVIPKELVEAVVAEAAHRGRFFSYPSGYTAVATANGGTNLARHGFVFSQDQDAWVALIKERFASGHLSDVA